MADKWLDRYEVLHPDHIAGLEQSAAINQFHDKLPRHEAEKKAYDDYKHEQLLDTAAHHLAGLRAAHSAGDEKNSKKHAVLYGLALRKLGHQEIGEPPEEVETRLKHAPQKVTSFKAHVGDRFLLDF